MDTAAQFALAYSLTTTAGLRGFVTLLAAAIATHFGWIHPSPSFAWVGSTGSIVVLSIFAVLEVLADKVPAIDHALHTVYFAVRPLAGAILVGDTINTSNQGELWALMAAGAANSLIVHGSSASLRAASTMTTMAIANPVLSFIEDAVSLIGIVLAFIAPFLAALLAILIVAALIFSVRTIMVRARRARA